MSTATVGYWYTMGVHLALCHGPVDAFLRIRTGTALLWSGLKISTESIEVNSPGLYGGEEKEGGVVGTINLRVGAANDPSNLYLGSKLPSQDYGVIPAFHNVASIVIEGAKIAANTPYLRPWHVMVRRLASSDWLTNYNGVDYSRIPQLTEEGVEPLYDANPAHIIRECILNPIWGLGYNLSDIDNGSFTEVAIALHSEGFGLSFVWSTSVSIHEFISTVIQHIDGSLFVSQSTGKFTLKLVRPLTPEAYAVVPEFNKTNILSVDSYDRTGVSDLINQVVLLWHDTLSDKQRSITVHNMATRELQGGVVSSTVDMPGISKPDLALKVANRELRKFSGAFSRITFVCDRSGYALVLGDVIRIAWEDYGIESELFRVAKIEYGTQDKTALRITCIEEIFHDTADIYSKPPESLTPQTIAAPAPCPNHSAFEAPYLLLYKEANLRNTDLSQIDTNAGFLVYVGDAPSTSAYSYDLYTRVSPASFTFKDKSRFCSNARIAAGLAQEWVSIITLLDAVHYEPLEVGALAHMGSEIIAVKAISGTVGSVTLLANQIAIDRGLYDTVPVTHGEERIWFTSNNYASDIIEYAEGVTVEAKASVLTGSGYLTLANAPTDTLLIKNRWFRPYPPGNVKMNGQACPVDSITARDVEITWESRNRLLQTTAYHVLQSDSSILAEAGTTYNIIVRDGNGDLLRAKSGIVGNSYTLRGNSFISPLTVQLWAVRDHVESYQKHSYTFTLNQTFDVVDCDSELASTVPVITSTDRIKFQFPNSKVNGVTPKVVQVLNLPAGKYKAPRAILGCVAGLGAATLELRKANGTVLATIGGTTGGIILRVAAAGFTLNKASNIEAVLYADASNHIATVKQLAV